MNQKETRARDAFKDKSLGRLKIHLIENMLSSGMMDAICINRRGRVCWIEFKADDEWPKRESTLPLKKSFEKGQIPFAKEWRSWNGLSYVLIKFGGEFYLLNPDGEKDLRESTKAELISGAVAIGLESIVAFLEFME